MPAAVIVSVPRAFRRFPGTHHVASHIDDRPTNLAMTDSPRIARLTVLGLVRWHISGLAHGSRIPVHRVAAGSDPTWTQLRRRDDP
jgi:hypothetical protein